MALRHCNQCIEGYDVAGAVCPYCQGQGQIEVGEKDAERETVRFCGLSVNDTGSVGALDLSGRVWVWTWDRMPGSQPEVPESGRWWVLPSPLEPTQESIAQDGRGGGRGGPDATTHQGR